MKPIITMTMNEIIDLAEFAGLTVDRVGFSDDELDAMLCIADCPKDGVHNDGEPGDPNTVSHYRYIAYYDEYPEEGCIGLGPEIEQNRPPHAPR